MYVLKCEQCIDLYKFEKFLIFKQQQNLGGRFGTSKMHLSPTSDLGCCPFEVGGSLVVDLMFIVTPIVRVCYFSMFCCTLCPF